MAEEIESNPPSSSSFEEDVKKIMGKGKVHLVCNESLEAVKCFEEATKKLDEKYGQAADECGEAYFYYGKSLLEVARMEGRVIGNALQGAIDPKEQENGDVKKITDQNMTGQNIDQNTEQVSEQRTDQEMEQEKEKSTEEKTDQISDECKKETKGETITSTTKTEEKTEKDLFIGPDINELDEDEKEKIGRDVTEAMTEDAFKEAIQEDAKEKKGELSEEKKETPEEAKEDIATEKDDTSKDSESEKNEGNQKGEAKSEDGEKNEDGEKIGGEKMEDEEKEEDEGDNEDEDMEEGTEDVEAEQTEEEEPTYMELAWQMLEVARIIFQRRENKEGKLMLAQCHLKLGEIQMEQEQFLSAVEDFLKCLDIQKEHLEPENRLLAETAYNIGLAFSFQGMYEKSGEYYTIALQTIELRIKNLEKSIEEHDAKSKGKEKATNDNPAVANRKELKELQELYPEIKAKVDDASEMMKQAKTQPDVSSLMGNGSSTTIGFGHTCNTDAPATMIATKKAPVAVTDISHLVHRNKRKPEEPSEDDSTAKKPRKDPEVSETNGKPTSTTNGESEETPIET